MSVRWAGNGTVSGYCVEGRVQKKNSERRRRRFHFQRTMAIRTPQFHQICVHCVAELILFFTLDNVLTSTRSAALRIYSRGLRQSGADRTSISADAGAGCSNSAEFSTKQTGSHSLKQQYNIWLLFQIKHFVLTPAHKSQKRDKHKLF